jgi:hypothetical protein
VPGGAAQLVEQCVTLSLDSLDPSEVVVGLCLGEILVQIGDAALELGPRPGVEHRDGAVLSPDGAAGEVEDMDVLPRPSEEGGEIVEALGITEPGRSAAVLDAPDVARQLDGTISSPVAWDRVRAAANVDVAMM